MEFKDRLNAYLTFLDCSGRELAQAAGISPATISRYRTGLRQPAGRDDPRLLQLSQGLAALAAQRGAALSSTVAFAELAASLPRLALPQDFHHRLDALMTALVVSNSEMARALRYDASFLSRVRSGSRVPADLPRFVQGVSRFAARRSSAEERARLAALRGTSPLPEDPAAAVAAWLLQLPE